MKIRSIIAQRTKIQLLLDACDGKSLTSKRTECHWFAGRTAPTSCRGAWWPLIPFLWWEGKAVFPRYADGYDLLLCRFEAFASERLEGVCYVTEFDHEASANHEALPQFAH